MMNIPLLEFGSFYAFVSSAVTNTENGIAFHLSSPDSHIENQLDIPSVAKTSQNLIVGENDITDKE